MTSQTGESKELRFYIKAVLICFAVWFVLFELVGTYASKLEFIDLTTRIDQSIPVVSEFVWIYQLCYILPILIVFILKDMHRMNLAMMSFMLVSLFGFIIYLIYPVGFERPELGNSLSDRLLALQYSIDFQPSANKLPSLHCAMSTILILACRKNCINKTYETLVILICVGIIISTLFVKQHILLDVLSGVGTGALVWWVIKRNYNQGQFHLERPGTSLLQFIRRLLPVWTILIVGLIIALLYSF